MNRVFPVLVAFLCLTAGCLSVGSSDPPSSSTPEPSGPTTKAPTPTPTEPVEAAEEPDDDKAIQLMNRWNQSVTMTVSVHRDSTNETVHHDTHEVAPGEERIAYRISEAEPAGIESFTAVVTVRNTTDRVTIVTNDCYGDAHAEVSADGALQVYYAIC